MNYIIAPSNFIDKEKKCYCKKKLTIGTDNVILSVTTQYTVRSVCMFERILKNAKIYRLRSDINCLRYDGYNFYLYNKLVE